MSRAVPPTEEVDQVLDRMRRELAATFGDTFSPDTIRVDVDILEGEEPLVPGRRLDSLDLVEAVSVIETSFDVSLADVLAGDEPMTLQDVARHIALLRHTS
jgi:acyl carrier protein